MAATEVTAKRMNMTEIIKKAKTIGIKPGKMKKAELRREAKPDALESSTFAFAPLRCAYN